MCVLFWRGRITPTLALIGLMGAIATPVSANTSAIVNQAQQQVQQDANTAAAQQTALSAAQSNLSNSQQQLANLQHQEATLDKSIASNNANLKDISVQMDADRSTLGVYVRQTYEQGSNADLTYLLSSQDISMAVQRTVTVNSVSNDADKLMQKLANEQKQTQSAVDALNDQRQQLRASEQQAATAEALVAVEEQQVQQQANAANIQLQQSKTQLSAAQAAANPTPTAIGNSANRRSGSSSGGGSKLTFPPVSGSDFTIDTNLTLPSGESAGSLNSYLSGTALAGLGGAFISAEQQSHVSAKYLLAHAIEESAFGTSRIAQDKHNLFGYGANDSNPYNDAVNFPSFAACINFVAQRVASNYLNPSGSFYHGPTLRGMNVSYATDPSWANNIARIANTIP